MLALRIQKFHLKINVMEAGADVKFIRFAHSLSTAEFTNRRAG